MAEDITGIFEQISEQSKSIDALNKSLAQLEKAKKSAFSAGDVSAILAFSKMEKALKKLMVTSEQYTEKQKELVKAQEQGQELNEEQLESLERLNKEHKTAINTVMAYKKASVDAHEALQRANEETEAKALHYWRTHTRIGKGFGFLSNQMLGFAARLSFVGLAWKALSRHVEATELRQNILIQSYQGFGDAAKLATDGTKAHTEQIDRQGKGFLATAVQADRFSSAMASAEATAQRMGVSTENVSDSMQKFAKITGVRTPEVLGKLTEGAITVSRALGITVPEAVDYVSLRMDKFGGSAASAIVSLNKIRTDTENVNHAFGRTVVRADDVVRTLMDISRQTNMYAIDQRFVGNILRDNIARLQATGDSYDSAQRKAAAFAKAVTGEAPEWMQVFAGQNIIGELKHKQIEDESGKLVNKLEDSMAAELDAAKPGLAQQVADILGDASMGYYSKMRLIQEITSGTTVGINAMNDQILKLANHPQGIIMIAKQFGVTHAEAYGMVEQAQKMKQQSRDLARLMSALNADQQDNVSLKTKSLELTEDQAKTAAAMNATERKGYLQALMAQKAESDAIDAQAKRLRAEDARNKAMQDSIKASIKMLEGKREKAADEDKKFYDKMIKDKKAELSRFESKTEEAGEGLKTVEETNKEILGLFEGYAQNTGGYYKSIITELSSVKMLLLGAIAVGITKYLFKQSNILDRIEGRLIKWSTGYGGAGDDGTHGGGGTMSPDQDTKKKKKPGRIQRGREWTKGKWERAKGFKFGRPSLRGVASGAKQLGGKAIDLGKYMTRFDTSSIDAGLSGAAAKFAKYSFGTSIALKVAGDAFGDVLETSGKDMQKVDASRIGTISKVTSALGMMPGPIGALSQAFEGGVLVGKLLNKGLDALGLTSDVVGDKMTKWATDGDSFFGGLLRKLPSFMGGVEGLKSDKEAQKQFLTKEDGSKSEAAEKLERAAKRFGISVEEYLSYSDEAAEHKLSIPKYLEQVKNKKQTVSTNVVVPTDTTNARPMKKEQAKLEKETREAKAKIPAQTTQALGLTAANVATGQQPISPTGASVLAVSQQEAQQLTESANQLAQTNTTGQDAMPASFIGGIQGDGSVMLKVDNFLPIFAKAQAVIKQKKIG